MRNMCNSLKLFSLPKVTELLVIAICISGAFTSKAIAAKPSNIQVPKIIYDTAVRNNIPIVYFYALAAKESSAKFKDGSRKPWAFTINHKGESFYFKNKKGMMSKANSLLSDGNNVFDVGWFQVNWRWHKGRVKSIAHLAEPTINAQVAADIYLEQYRKYKDWNVAAGRYHNPNNNKGYADIYEKSFREYVSLIRKGKY